MLTEPVLLHFLREKRERQPMRVPVGPAGPPISTTARPWVGSLAELLQPWTDALNNLSGSAKKNLDMCSQSLTTFENHCQTLIGDTTLVFQGLGAKAFANLAALNKGHALLVNAKIHDFSNASRNLLSDIQGLTSQYEVSNPRYENDGGGGFPNPVIYQFTGGMSYPDMLHTLMDGFLTTTSMDALLDPRGIRATIHDGIQVGLHHLIDKITTGYQTLPVVHDELQMTPDQLHSNDGYFYWDLRKHKTEYHTSIEIVQGLARNMETQLETWALALYELAKQYAQEVSDAAQINRPTVSDFIFEASQPAFANQSVLIWQLPNGGLFIMVKGGHKHHDEQLIKDYLKNVPDRKVPLVTILGYQDGILAAQQIINDAQFQGDQPNHKNPNAILSINIINAIMVGNQSDIPGEPTDSPVNYINYSLNPEEKKVWSLLGLNEEQAITMGVTTVVALVLDQPELMAGDIAAVLGKVGAEKLTEYALALGFNAADSGNPQAAAQYLIDWTKNHNVEKVTLSDGQTMPYPAYVGLQLSGQHPLKIVGRSFDHTYALPNEPNLQKDFGKSAYLGEQFVLDPVGMKQVEDGVVTIPAIPKFPNQQ